MVPESTKALRVSSITVGPLGPDQFIPMPIVVIRWVTRSRLIEASPGDESEMTSALMILWRVRERENPPMLRFFVSLLLPSIFRVGPPGSVSSPCWPCVLFWGKQIAIIRISGDKPERKHGALLAVFCFLPFRAFPISKSVCPWSRFPFWGRGMGNPYFILHKGKILWFSGFSRVALAG